MLPATRSLNVLLLSSFLALVPSLGSCQQYEGETITNSLPSVPGSEIAYFKITDPNGSDANLTLTNYISHNSAGDRVEGSTTKRALIVIHGAERDPGTYMSNLLSALSQVPNSDVNFDSVAICAPYFPNGADKTTGYPWTDGLAAGHGSTSSALVWSGALWADGGNNMYPYKTTTVSSYEALDQLVKYFDDSSVFPSMQQIVIAGHSLGGQFVNRYAAVGNELGLTTPISYWIGNPNSFVWFSTERPLDDSDCSDYDVWRDGFTNYSAINTYGDAIVAEGRDAVLARYNSRSIAYGRGVQDLGDTSSTCAPETTGGNRNERFFNFIADFPPSCPNPSVGGPCSTIDYVQAGHDASVMFASSAGQARLFLDNFNGTGVIAYDFGYPRRQTGDDPYPDPALNGSTSTGTTVYYAGNMSYYGCFTDQDPRTLTYTAYSSTGNTIELCTSTCDNAGYTVAGMEYGAECYCGDVLTAKAEQVVDNGCTIECPGNSSETCGASDRLSIYSNGTPTQLASPSAPATLGAFTYQGCRTEATSAHVFNDASTSSSTAMTLELCASYCEGYTYFGAEYAGECYCGNEIGDGSTTVTRADCYMTCTGNDLEPCGAGNYLTWYEDESKVTTVSTI